MPQENYFIILKYVIIKLEDALRQQSLNNFLPGLIAGFLMGVKHEDKTSSGKPARIKRSILPEKALIP